MGYNVYVFLDNLNRPYYVGKTNSMARRRKEHLKEIKDGNTLPKYKVARKYIKQGYPLKMRTIRTTKSEAYAYKLERYYIKKYRADGYMLFNCTYGGPDEIPMKIVKPKKWKTSGIKLSRKKHKKSKSVRKKIKKKSRIKKKRKK